MSTSSAVPRTAPIAIAPKPSRLPPSRQHSIHTDSGHDGRSRFTSPDSDSPVNRHSPVPCEACLLRRSRCTMGDGDDSCVSCQISGTECSLVESPQPRKRKLMMNGDVENSLSKRSSPARSSDNNRRRRQHQSTSLSSTAASSSLIEEMANFGGPTLLKRTLGLQSDRYSQYIGPTTDFEPSLINLSPFDPHDESLLARGTLRKVSGNDTFLLLPDHATPGYEHVLDDVEEIEGVVAPHGRQLIDLYFRVVHPAFPIIQKTVFYEKYERSYREFSPPLLAAIYILAVNWWDHDEALAPLPRPDVRRLERLVRTTLADAMYRPKLSTVQAGLLLSQRPEGDQWAPTGQLVTIAQELGLHLDCTGWKIPPWERGLRKRLAWAMYMQDKWGALVHGRPSHISSANWAVQTLTPNDFPDVEWDEDDVDEQLEIERGRTLFAHMVQLSQILAEILETFYTLQASQEVTRAGVHGTQLVLSRAKPIQLKLKEWYGSLPAAIRMDSSFQSGAASAAATTSAAAAAAAAAIGSTAGAAGGSGAPPPNRLSSVGYLHLAYFATEITLHRRIIRSIDESSTPTVPSPSPSSTAERPSSSLPGSGSSSNTGSRTMSAHQHHQAPAPASSPSPTIDPYVQGICRSAAKARLISAMDFVNRLTPSHLRAFWYFASKTNFALIGTFGSLLWATSPSREEADWYRRRLGEYRWTLSVSSKPSSSSSAAAGGGGGGGAAAGDGLTEFAMGMLDISTGLLKQLPEKPLLSPSGSALDMEAIRRQSVLFPSAAPGSVVMGMGMNMGMGMGMSMGSVGGMNFGGFDAYGGLMPGSEVMSGLQSPGSGGSESSGESG